jgi:hypothetical protein
VIKKTYVAVAQLVFAAGLGCAGRVETQSTDEATGGMYSNQAEGGHAGTPNESPGGGSMIGTVAGTGGATITYSSKATGATKSRGGSTSVGGNSNEVSVIDSFDNIAQMQMFTPNTFQATDCSVNVAAPNDAGAVAQFDWSGTVDVNADAIVPGSMKVTATFTGWDQRIAVEMNAPADAQGDPLDLTNKLVTAEIKIASGSSPNANFPYGAQLYVKTGTNYVWGSSVWSNITALNTWVRLVLDTTAPDGVPAGSVFDPSLPRQLGIQLSTGGANESSYCAGNYAAPFGPPQVTVFYIDQIQVETRP